MPRLISSSVENMDVDTEENDIENETSDFSDLLKRLDRISSSQDELARLMQAQLETQRKEVDEIRRFVVENQSKQLKIQARQLKKFETLHRRRLSAFSIQQTPVPTPQQKAVQSFADSVETTPIGKGNYTSVILEEEEEEVPKVSKAGRGESGPSGESGAHQNTGSSEVGEKPTDDCQNLETRRESQGSTVDSAAAQLLNQYTETDETNQADVSFEDLSANTLREDNSPPLPEPSTITPMQDEHNVTPMQNVASQGVQGFTSVNKPRAPVASMFSKSAPNQMSPAKTPVSITSTARPVQRARCSRGRGARRTSPSLPNRAEVVAVAKRKRLTNPPPQEPPFKGAPLNPMLFKLSTLKAHYHGEIRGPMLYKENRKITMLLDPRRQMPVPTNMMQDAVVLDLSHYEWIATVQAEHHEQFPVFLYVPGKRAYLYCGEYNWVNESWLEMNSTRFQELPDDVQDYWVNRCTKGTDEYAIEAVEASGISHHRITREQIQRKFRMDGKNSLHLSTVAMTPDRFMRKTYDTLVKLAKKRSEDGLHFYDVYTEVDSDINLIELGPSTAKKVRTQPARIEDQDATVGTIQFPIGRTSPTATLRPKRTAASKTAGEYDMRQLSRDSIGNMSDFEGANDENSDSEVEGAEHLQQKSPRKKFPRAYEIVETSEEE